MPQDVILARNVEGARKVAEVLTNFEILKKESLKRHQRLCGWYKLDHSERTPVCIVLGSVFPSSLLSIRGCCPAHILKCKTLNQSVMCVFHFG